MDEIGVAKAWGMTPSQLRALAHDDQVDIMAYEMMQRMMLAVERKASEESAEALRRELEGLSHG